MFRKDAGSKVCSLHGFPTAKCDQSQNGLQVSGESGISDRFGALTGLLCSVFICYSFPPTSTSQLSPWFRQTTDVSFLPIGWAGGEVFRGGFPCHKNQSFRCNSGHESRPPVECYLGVHFIRKPLYPKKNIPFKSSCVPCAVYFRFWRIGFDPKLVESKHSLDNCLVL